MRLIASTALKFEVKSVVPDGAVKHAAVRRKRWSVYVAVKQFLKDDKIGSAPLQPSTCYAIKI